MRSIRFDDLTLGYDRHPAVHHLSGTLEAGRLTAAIMPLVEILIAVATGLVLAHAAASQPERI